MAESPKAWEARLDILSRATETVLGEAKSQEVLDDVLGLIQGERGTLAVLVRQLNALGVEGEEGRRLSWLFERYKGNVAVWYETRAATLRGEVDDG